MSILNFTFNNSNNVTLANQTYKRTLLDKILVIQLLIFLYTTKLPRFNSRTRSNKIEKPEKLLRSAWTKNAVEPGKESEIDWQVVSNCTICKRILPLIICSYLKKDDNHSLTINIDSHPQVTLSTLQIVNQEHSVTLEPSAILKWKVFTLKWLLISS